MDLPVNWVDPPPEQTAQPPPVQQAQRPVEEPNIEGPPGEMRELIRETNPQFTYQGFKKPTGEHAVRWVPAGFSDEPQDMTPIGDVLARMPQVAQELKRRGLVREDPAGMVNYGEGNYASAEVALDPDMRHSIQKLVELQRRSRQK